MEASSLLERQLMESERGNEHILHIFVSNQSVTMTAAKIEVTIDGQQMFYREMTTGTQHNWSEVILSVASGHHTIAVIEEKTQTRTAKPVDANRELWIVVMFSSPPAKLKLEVFDHPVSFM